MDFLIRRKVLISMLFIGLSLMGYVSYKNLSVELFPNAELPILYVQVNSFTESDPKYLENQVVVPLEGTIGTMEGIERIESFINPQQASILVTFKKNVNFKYAYLRLQEKIDNIKSSLPENFIVTVTKIDLQQLTNQFMELQIRGSGGVDRVRNFADLKIKPKLENIDGIAGVNIFGGRQKTIEIQLDMNALEAYNISTSQIRGALNQNARNRTFVGFLHESEKKHFVHVSAEYNKISDIENIVLAAGPILLRDVAKVFFGVKETSTLSRVNGKDAVTVLLVNDAQANLIDLSKSTREEIEEINKNLKAADIEIVIQNDAAEVMEKNINQIINLAIVGGLMAVLLLWIFLKNIRIVSFIAISIPISVYAAFNFFYWNDITLNTLTLVGIALAIGMLLDNSVVVLENVYRLFSNGRSSDESVVLGTKEVQRPIIAATLTSITVFLPFVFSSNFLIKLLGKHIGVSIISTLIVSLFVALLLIPMATHFLLNRKNKKTIFFEKVTISNRIVQIYILLLKACMRYPIRTIVGALVIFFVAIFISLAISMNSLSEPESNQFQIYVTMPAGSTLDATDKVVQEVENRIGDFDEKKDLICKIQEEEAIITVQLIDELEKKSDRNLGEIKDDVEEKIKGVSGAEIGMEPPPASRSFRGSSNNPGEAFQRILGIGSNRERVIIKGQDFEAMLGVAEDIRYYFDNLESMRTVSISVSDNQPEVQLHFNSLLMASYGISLQNVATELNSFSKEFTSGLKFNFDNEEYDIIIKEEQKEDVDEDKNNEKTIHDLRTLQIRDQSNGQHDLQAISDIVFSKGVFWINRVNQEKQIELNYTFVRAAEESKELLKSYRLEIDQIISSYNLPSGIAIEVIHEENELKDFKWLILASFILIFMILAAVFESLSTPFVLMFSIPLAAIGSMLALIITGNSLLSANTLTGFLILLGIVVNNGIILIDFSNLLIKKGYRRSRALIVAGISRVRPILITAITTIVAMFPLAMGKAEYVSIIGAPFAITVIGGLAVSTILTLIFIPTFYLGLENAIAWVKSLDWKIRLLQVFVFIIGTSLIYLRVSSTLWQILLFVLLILLVPGITWFVTSSLKMARAEVIPATDSLKIVIQNLVKIYDRDSRFKREWKGGQKIRERAGLQKQYKNFRDFYDLYWQILLFGFLIYFTYFYLQRGFWVLFFSIIVYLNVFLLYRPLSMFLKDKAASLPSRFLNRLEKVLYKLLFWGIPLINIYYFSTSWDTLGIVIAVGILWYLAIIIYSIAQELYQKDVKIEQISGTFGTIRRDFLRLVKRIPVIGKRNQPFKALSGVSLEIGTGMFGLLGPNGAGKSTLMRIVCGILDQSYGKIWINGIDTEMQREELQGLIGYLPQEFGSYEKMTAFEFLDYQAILKGINDHKIRKKRLDYVLSSVHMLHRANEKIESFSGGMKQRIGIAQILLHLPRILVVDEPTAGLDPRERIRFRNLLVELSRERIVLFSTHIIEDISSSCKTVAVINKGKLNYTGTPTDMVDLARGLVWQFRLPANEFEQLLGKELIVHHMREGDEVRVRMISSTKPKENAEMATPLLEDAYLCLLNDIKVGNSD